MNQQQQDPQQKTGRAMLYVGWVICLAVLVYLFGNWESTRLNPNQNVQGRIVEGNAEIVLQRNPQGHYILNAEVNGKVISFLVDTGASQLVFTEAQASKAGLKSGPSYYVSTANGDIRVQSTSVNTLRMGNIELYDLPAAINPHMDGYALLGMSALVNLEWRQRGDELIITQY